MEYKDPAFELLSNLEQIIFKDQAQAASLTRKP
ncbi:MAG: transcriptional regulator, partial [Klebsiella oxytoca]|nr:transcriptional regulator [Klebsiella oxytoca]